MTATSTYLNSNNLPFYIKCSYLLWIIISLFYLSHDRTLTNITTPGQSEPESNGNEGVSHTPQSSRITI